MARGSAKQLLYGPRRRGPGPKARAALVSFDLLTDSLRQGRLPVWIEEEVPTIALYGESNVYHNGGIGGDITTILIDGFGEDIVELSLYRERGRETIAFSYDLDNNPGGDPQPGTMEEKALLRTLANNISNNVKVEFITLNGRQIDNLLDSYRGPSQAQLRFASSSFTEEQSEAEIITSLTDGILEEASHFSSLQKMLATPGGRELLSELNDRTTVYLEASLKDFAEGL